VSALEPAGDAPPLRRLILMSFRAAPTQSCSCYPVSPTGKSTDVSNIPPMTAIDLIAVQPYMTFADYRDADAFSAHVERLGAVIAAKRQNPAALVVFPEDFATFLALMAAPRDIQEAATLDEAFSRIGRRYAPTLLRTMAALRTPSLRAAFFAWAARSVWPVWHETMATLAKRLDAVVVAGSALLPQNRFGPDTARYEPASARVYNLALTFGPDGHVVAETLKHNLVPTQEDKLGLTAGPPDPPVFSVGPVRAATAICYDAFVVPHTPREPRFRSLVPAAAARGAEVIAQPSANPWWWNEPWPFAPDAGLTRREQWTREGLKAAMEREPRIRAGVNPQLLARLFDVHFDGQSAIYARLGDHVATVAEAPRPDADPAGETVIAWSMPITTKSGMF
jgi:predicted amidohydrolase